MKRRLIAEGLGTALLLAAVVGSGVMAERLSGGNNGVALLRHCYRDRRGSVPADFEFRRPIGRSFQSRRQPRHGHQPGATVAAGRTLCSRPDGWSDPRRMGCPPDVRHADLTASPKVRTGIGQWAGEFVATFGLIMVIECGRRRFPAQLPATVATYIVAAYWFTSSTSFANPAVTIARSPTATFAGIAPGNAAAFILSQFAGALASGLLFGWLYRRSEYDRGVGDRRLAEVSA
jgi:hypothetical protein